MPALQPAPIPPFTLIGHRLSAVCVLLLCFVIGPMPAQEVQGSGALRLAGPWNASEALLVQLLNWRAQNWARLQWETSLTAARARAAAEGRPIFMVVNTGHPLGYV